MKPVEGVLSPAELETVQAFLSSAQFVDGKLTAGTLAKKRKNNLQIDSAQEGVKLLDEVIIKALSRNELFMTLVKPLTFSAPLYARYEKGMNYGAHVDAPIMGLGGKPLRTDVSVTVFLNDPTEYEGGELSIDIEGVVQTVKLPAGSAIVYPTTHLHQVNEVTKGKREVAVLWAQSMVKDAHIRSTLFDLQVACDSVSTSGQHPLESQLLQKSLMNLQRHFIEC